MSRSPADSFDETRARFVEDRARLVERHRRGAGGLVVVRAYRKLVDGVVADLAARHLPRSPGLCVLAVGGYGRGELGLASDVDLHLLLPPGEPPGGARTFLQSLWDMGWDVGHQVVDHDQALDLAASDRETLTALLEMRPVWGDEAAAGRLADDVRGQVLLPGLEPYLEAKREELERRHRQAGDTVYLSEPDVKESPGGLRDIHTLLWMSNASGGPATWSDYLAVATPGADSWRRLKKGYDMLWRVRNTLHIEKGRRWDRLDHRSQTEVANRLAYGSTTDRLAVEIFMREYYRAAWALFAYARVEMARLGHPPREKNRTMLTVLRPDEEAEAWDTTTLSEHPVQVIPLFGGLAERQASLEAETAAWLMRNGVRIGRAARRDPTHGALFMRLLRSPRAAWSLHAMHQFRILGAILPEFDHIDALVQFDPYHHYTVDEHTLRMLDILEALLTPDTGPDPAETGASLQSARVGLGLPEQGLAPSDAAILRLAILFHDTGKGTGKGGHAERGARMVRRAGRRLHVDGSDLQDAVFLVRYHLMLNSAAQRRDTRDPALIRRIARLVRSETRLRLLTFLTVCDLAAVGPSTLTPWKCRLLFELRDRVLARIVGAVRPDEPPAERLLRLLPDEGRESARVFLDGMPAEYFSGVDPEHVLADRSLVETFRSSGDVPVLGIRPVGGATEITLIARDRPGLLSRFCGLLSAHDLTILRARIATRLDGIVLDRLAVADAASGGPISAAQEAGVRADLAGALDGSVPVAPLLERHRARWRLRDRRRMEHPVRIAFDDRASERYTVLEVRAADHVGLLWEITRTMSDMGAAIHQAFITTEGERAVDAFYLTDPLGAPLDAATREVLASRLREVLQGGDQSVGK